MKLILPLLAPLAAFAAAPASDWSPNLTASTVWVGNIDNGEAVWDRISTLRLSADALASARYGFGRFDAAHATLHVRADWVPRFGMLDRGLLGGRLDWQHEFGVGDRAPVFTAEAAGDYAGTVETSRRGTIGAITLTLEQRIGVGWRAAVRERFEDYRAKAPVFDNRSSETNVEISRDLNETTRLTLTGIYRDGDVVTYAQYHRPDLQAIARDMATLKTFHTPMTAYATSAPSKGGRLALVHATSDSTAVALSYEYTSTRRVGLKFENQLIAVSYIEQY